MKALAIWGASGHGRVVVDAARLQGCFSIVGFVDDDASRCGQAFAGTEVLGGREVLATLLKRGIDRIHVAVGHCATRAKLADDALALGFKLQTVVHPRSVVATDAVIGEGSFVAAGVVVNSASVIGRNVILNTNCSVDHDCSLGSNVHVAPGARLGGLVHVGDETLIGIGAVVLNCLKIGERSVIGGGAVAVRDIPSGVVAFGVPAKVVREKHAND